MKILIFTLLLNLISRISSKIEAQVYSHYKVELTWPGSFCQQKPCNVYHSGDYKGEHFTLHGVWPTGVPTDHCLYVTNC